MPLQAAAAGPGGDSGSTGRSGHVSGRIVSVAQTLRARPEDTSRVIPQRPGEQWQGTSEQYFSGGLASGGDAIRRSTTSSGGLSSGEDSYTAAPPRRRPQPINAELVKLVASFAPLELAQLKAMEQKARLKARAGATGRGEAVDEAAPQEDAVGAEVPSYELEPLVGQGMEPTVQHEAALARTTVRATASKPTGYPKPVATGTSSRPHSRSPKRPSYLLAAPVKGAIVKRDLNMLPNPVAQKQAEVRDRKKAVNDFMYGLQRKHDALRAEKDRRLKAEQDALAAQLEEEPRKAAEEDQVQEVKPIPGKKKEKSTRTSGFPAMQAASAEPAEKKPVDPRPWRQNMRKPKASGEPLDEDGPVGAPLDVASKAATDAPPPRNLSPGAAAARIRTLDPVARAQIQEYMRRKDKEMSAKQQQERAAQQEAKTAHLKVIKAEMAKARERAQKYAEASKDSSKGYQGPRPAWVDVLPADGSAPAPLRATSAQRFPRGEPDADLVSERVMPYHMSDAMRMEFAERRRQERIYGISSPTSTRNVRAVLVDSFGQPLDDERMDKGAQVVRVHDPDVPAHGGSVYRASSVQPTRPIIGIKPSSAQAAMRNLQMGQPVAPEAMRAMEAEARPAARKQYEQQLRDVQLAERRDLCRSRDTSRGRDTARGRRTSPTAGRKHQAASVNSHSRSPPKRAKQQSRRSRSASRAGSANRRTSGLGAIQPVSLGGARLEDVSPQKHATAIQAEMQQARNERQVGDLWDLALQLSARLGALRQQQQGPTGPVLHAWPDPRALQDVRESATGSLLPYPPPIAVVPTALAFGPSDIGAQESPKKVVPVHQFDEGQLAEVEFRTEVSWPMGANKKMRTDGGNSYGGASDTTIGLATGAVSSMGAFTGAPTSVFGSASQQDAGASALNLDQDVSSLGGSASSLSIGLQPPSDAALAAPSLHTEGSSHADNRDEDVPAPTSIALAESDASVSELESELRSGRDKDIQLPEDKISIPAKAQHTVPTSPSKAVPAAPLIQIPVSTSGGKAVVDGVQPAPGLPYDNATFSAESADEGDSSGSEESTYGQRVLSIAELHGMLEDNPRLSQRLSLDRERDRWEEEGERQSSSQHSHHRRIETGLKRPAQRSPSASPSSGDADDSSLESSAMGTPTRACEEVVTEYEQANSPLRLRPAQRELLKVQAVKRAEAQREQTSLQPFDTAEPIPGEESSDAGSVQFPKAEDPMSIISLIANKGRIKARPAIIQLSSPPLQEVAEHETQTQPAIVGANDQQPQLLSEVLVIPKPSGPELVFSRELLQPVSRLSSPNKASRDAGVGEGCVNAAEPTAVTAQSLASSLPPFIITAAAPAAAVTPAVAQEHEGGQGGQHFGPVWPSPAAVDHEPPVRPDAQSSLQRSVDTLLQDFRQSSPVQPTLSEQLARLEEQRSGGGFAPTIHTSTGGSSSMPLGAVPSPPPRLRTVTFVDEAQGPPERVRLAPTELFRQMQDTLKTYEELDAAEAELHQLQNARAIAAVQREAHRIAQRLDQTHVAETQMQLLAQTQAEMDSKLHALEENIRNEVRREGLGQLHDIAAMFVQQLSRNKVAHATVQTTPQSPRPSRHEFGVQVDPPSTQHPVSILRSSSPPEGQLRPYQTSLRSASPPHTSTRATSPPQPLKSSFRASSPPLGPEPSSRSQSPPQATHTTLRDTSTSPDPTRLPSRGASPGPAGPSRSSRRLSTTSNPVSSEYTEDFDEGELTQSSFISGRPTSRAATRQVSYLSVPESVAEELPDTEGDETIRSEYVSQDIKTQTSVGASIPERLSSYHRDRQPSRASIRQTSATSIPESVQTDRSPSRLASRQQTSALSVLDDVIEDISATPGRSGLGQPSATSIAESIRSQQTADSYSRSTRVASEGGSRRRSSALESVPYSSAPGDYTREASSIQESLSAHQSFMRSGGKRVSDRSLRRRSTIGTEPTSEPQYSSTFDEEGDTEEVPESSRDNTRTATGGVSTDIPESEPSGKRIRQQQHSSQLTATATTHSVGSDNEVPTEQEDSSSREVADEIGLESSRSASRGSAQRPAPQQAPSTGATRGLIFGEGQLGAMPSPVPTRTPVRRADVEASPLNLRASLEGGLELDDEMMSSYTAEAEARMRQELGLLTDRLLDVNTRASTKMAQLEAELATESVPQKRQAIIRAQRLVQVQHDADAADIQRQISAVKADFARQQLMLERLYRLAQITSPAVAGSTKKSSSQPGTLPRVGFERQPTTAPAARATIPPRRPSTSSSIAEDRSAQRAVSTSGSVRNEVSSRLTLQSSASGLGQQPPRAWHKSASGSVAEESMEGSAASEVASEVSNEYSSERFEPVSAIPSRGHLRPAAGKMAESSSQRSGVTDEVEESLSSRRAGTSRVQSESTYAKSVSVEGASKDTSSQRQTRLHSSGSVAATEVGYSDEFQAPAPSSLRPSTSQARQSQARQRRAAPAAEEKERDEETSGGESELSVQSSEMERKRKELQRLLREEEREQRRARIHAKEVEIAQLQAQLKALRSKRAGAASPALRSSTTARKAKPAGSDEDGKDEALPSAETSIRSSGPARNEARTSGISESDIEDDVPASDGVEEESIMEEQEDDEVETSGAVPTSSSQGRDNTYGSSEKYDTYQSSGTREESAVSSEQPQDSVLDALKKEIASLEQEKQRLRQAEVEALQAYKRKLADEVKSLKSKPPVPKPAKVPMPAPTPGRKPAAASTEPSPGASGDSGTYSDDFQPSGTSGSIVEGRGAKASTSTSRSQSSIGEQSGLGVSAANVPSRVGGSRSSSIVDEDSSRAAGASRSSGTTGRSSHRKSSGPSGSGDLYEESFDSESMRGSVLPEASDIVDEIQASGDHSSDAHARSALEPIREEEVPSSSVRSLTFAVEDPSAEVEVQESEVVGGSAVDDEVRESGLTPESIADDEVRESGLTPESIADDVIRESGLTPESIADDEVREPGLPHQSTADEIQESGLTPESVIGDDVHESALTAESIGDDEARDSGLAPESTPDEEVQESGLTQESFADVEVEASGVVEDYGVSEEVHESELDAPVASISGGQLSVESLGLAEEGFTQDVASVVDRDEAPSEELSIASPSRDSGTPSLQDAAVIQYHSPSASTEGSQQAIVDEFLTTADINTPSVAPSVHSAELEGEQSSASTVIPSAVSNDIPVKEFLTSADTIGESAAPSVRSPTGSAAQDNDDILESALIEDGSVTASVQSTSTSVAQEGLRSLGSSQSASKGVEIEEPFIVRQGSSSSSSSGQVADEAATSARMGGSAQSSTDGMSMQEEAAARGVDSGSTRPASAEVENSEAFGPTNLEIEESESEDEEPESEVEEEDREVNEDSDSEAAEILMDMDDLEEPSYAMDLDVEAVEETAEVAEASADVVEAREESVQESAAEEMEASSSAAAINTRDETLLQTDMTIAEESGGTQEPQSSDTVEDAPVQQVTSRVSSPSVPSSSSSSSSTTTPTEEAEETDYELDFQPSAIEVQAEESLQPSVGRGSGPRSGSHSSSTGELVQSASELLAQTSILDVASTASLGASRAHISAEPAPSSIRGAASSLQQQASSVSVATYEEDGEASEVQLPGLGQADRTTTTVLEDEADGLQPKDVTASRMYSDEFNSESTLQATATVTSLVAPEMSAEASAPAAPPADTSVNQSVEDAEEDIAEDVTYSEDEPEPEEDGHQYSAGTGATFGLVLQPGVATSMAMEVSQRYGAVSDDTFELPVEASELQQEPSAEEQSSLLGPGDTLGRDQAPSKRSSSGSSSSSGRSDRTKAKSDSVFSIEEEGPGSGTVSSDASAAGLPIAAVGNEAGKSASAGAVESEPSRAGAAPDIEEEDVDEYTREFTSLASNVEGATAATHVAQQEANQGVVSHPISQPPSPTAQSEQEYTDEEKEVEEEELEQAELDASDLGLHEPTGHAGAVITGEVSSREIAGRTVAGALDTEESGVIGVVGGRSLQQTRQIESRAWRNQHRVDEEDEEEDAGLDLVDVSMTAGETSGGLLEFLHPDLIESNEAITPSNSFRVRSGELASGPSSGSPFAMRRLATLREQHDQEGEESESSSEVVTPSARVPRTLDGAGGDGLSRFASVGEQIAAAGETEGNAAVSAEDDETGSAAQEPVAARKEHSDVQPSDEPLGAAKEPERKGVSRETSAEYSDSGLEAPASEGSAGRQSVVEYDMYTSAALADDSDELAEVAAAFESQAIGGDDDEDDVPAEYSEISASGLSDDLAKYKVDVQPDSDDEAAKDGPAASVSEGAASKTVPSPQPAEAKAPSVEASEVADEVVDEELEAGGNDPFSVDESIDRLPALGPAGSVTPPAPLQQQSSTGQAAAAAGERAKAAGIEGGEEVEKEGVAKSSPTVSSPKSQRSSEGALVVESSLGPLPRSGLAESDDEDDGQGLAYRPLYKAQDVEPSAAAAAGPFTAVPEVSAVGTEASAAAPLEEDTKSKSGLLEQIRAYAESEDEEELGGGPLARVSGTSIKPVLQALLDEPESDVDQHKGDFASEIERMLTESRSRSRLPSPYQSRDWAEPEAQEAEGTTPMLLSERASLTGAPLAPTVSAVVPAADAATDPELQVEAEAPLGRDQIVDEITESTVKELVADAVNAIDGGTEAKPAAVPTGITASAEQADGAAAPSVPAEDRSRVSVGGEASISMSVDDLEGDIELEELAVEDDAGLDLPSPLPSDSGSLGSPVRSAFEHPGASKLSTATSNAPGLAVERSGRDMSLSAEEAPGDSGVGLNSDEDLGWGGADDDADLGDEWQPDLSGYIAPAIDQAAIERENAPAVAAHQEAVAQYAEQVLDQFMVSRPEFLAPGAEPLSLEGFLDQERRLVHASEAQHIHNKMVYDAINEALLAIYRTANRVQVQPWLHRNRIVKPLPDPKEMAEQVQQQLRTWAAMRVRESADIDKVLVTDAVEDERTRGDLAMEEAEVQREVADLIWAELIGDTAEVLSDLQQLLEPASTPPTRLAPVSGPSRYGLGTGSGLRRRMDDTARTVHNAER